jgi:CheY-like chemotaxis protein
VDDEPMLLTVAESALREHGYQVLLAGDGEEAVQRYREAQGTIDLVVLDRTMPRLSGRDTLRRLRQLDTNVAVLFASGYAAEQMSEDERSHVRGFLSKPYSVEELLEAVRAVLDGGRVQANAPGPT